jgi:hypothetical protein
VEWLDPARPPLVQPTIVSSEISLQPPKKHLIVYAKSKATTLDMGWQTALARVADHGKMANSNHRENKSAVHTSSSEMVEALPF